MFYIKYELFKLDGVRSKAEANVSWGWVRLWDKSHGRETILVSHDQPGYKTYYLGPHESVEIEVLVQSTGHYGCPNANGNLVPLNYIIFNAPRFAIEIENTPGQFEALLTPPFHNLVLQRDAIRPEEDIVAEYSHDTFPLACHILASE